MKKSILAITILSLSGAVFAQEAAIPKVNAELLYLFTTQGKANLISEGYVKATDFSHPNPNALVIKADKKLDISNVEQFEDVKANCFMGTPVDAKSIVEKLILNADGNGDSYVESMTVTTSERKVSAKYALITEGGQSDHEFEVESCEPPTAAIKKDPVFGKYDMCDESIVKLPDQVYDDLKRISDSQNMEQIKLDQVKELFRGIALNKSMQNYCTAVASVMENTEGRCQEAMQDEGLFDPQILGLTKLNASQDEVLCSLSAMIALMISPF